MGGSRWDNNDWKSYAKVNSYATKSMDDIFTSRKINNYLDPKNISVRESRDSDANPNSTAIIVGLDVTGSMGHLAETIAKKGLNTLITEIYNRKPVTDPHILIMGIGDADAGDKAPLQATQFEADLKLIEQLERIFIEHGGGGNNYESYILAWFFAARKTSTDCLEKRGKKGYLFTIGDEEPTPSLTSVAANVIGETIQSDISAKELLAIVSRQYEVFHIIIEEGNHACAHGPKVKTAWTNLLGQRALPLSDHTKLAEVIVSAIQAVEGVDHDTIHKSWDGNTGLVVSKAITGLTKMTTNNDGIVRL